MPYYQYKALNNDGAVVRGTLEALDLEAAEQSSVMTPLHILSIKETSGTLIALRNSFRARQVKREQLVEFANNLAVMLRAGIPIVGALNDLAESAEDPYLLEVIGQVRSDISMGSSFGAAVSKHPQVFPAMFIRLVSVGEETGNLDGSLEEAAVHIQRVEDLTSAMKQAMIYPMFAFVTTLGSLIFWLVYVLPKMTSLFKEMGVKIPAITRFLILMSSFTRQYWLLLLILPFLLFFGIRLVRRSERGEYLLDQSMLKLPVLQLILINKSLGIFTEQMRILIKSGLTIDRCFDLAGGVVGNRVYQDAIGRVKQEVLAGATISESMAMQKVFPPMLLRMVHVGEMSGTLDEQFAFLAAYYVKRLNEVSERLGKMLEPIMIIFLGIMFAVIILGLLLPIYDLISNIGRM